MQTDNTMVNLPNTFEGYIEVIKKHGECVSYNQPPDVKIITRFSGAAVGSNRSCGDVIIMMAGYSGAGKSETINNLFNKEVCTTNSKTSETRCVLEIEAPLMVRVHRQTINIPLKFVDVPGALDVNKALRDQHQRSIEVYLRNSPNLFPRSNNVLSQLGLTYPTTAPLEAIQEHDSIPTNEYQKAFPNLILLVVNALDNRLVGEDSDFAETLKLFKKLNAVDVQRLNLIVVATHAGYWRRTNFSKKATEKTEEIRNLLVEHLGEYLKETKVIFVENHPQDCELEKIEGSEFYKLPDGSTSHCTLIQEMTKTFLANGDILGSFACGAFFGDKPCGKPLQEGEITRNMQIDDVNPEDEARRMDRVHLNLVQELPLKLLAHGFCPIKELAKSNTILAISETKNLGFKNSYMTHSKIKDRVISTGDRTLIARLSHKTSEDYVKAMLDRYELSNDTKLTEIALTMSHHTKLNDSTVIYLYEWRICKVEVDCEIANMCEELIADLSELPPVFDDSTQKTFLDFFDEWGSHFVQKSYLGGSMKIVVPASHSLNLTELQNHFDQRFSSLMEIETNEPFSSPADVIDYSKINVIVNGGKQPAITHLNELTSELLKTWIQSIESYPAELPDFVTLQPYHILIKGPQRDSLMKAVHKYFELSREAPSLTRDNIADAIIDVTINESLKSKFIRVAYELSPAARVAVFAVLIVPQPIVLPVFGLAMGLSNLKKIAQRAWKEFEWEEFEEFGSTQKYN